MGRAGEAVVAHDAVCDEVARPRGDVIQTHRLAERANRGHTQLGGCLNGTSLDCALKRDRRIGGEEEAHPLGETAAQTNAGRATAGPRYGLHVVVEAKTGESGLDPREDLRIRVRDVQCLVAARAPGIEAACEEPLHPGRAGRDRPADQLADPCGVALGLCEDRRHRPVVAGSLRERELHPGHAKAGEILPRALQRLAVGEGEAKAVRRATRTTKPLVDIGLDAAVCANEAAKVAASVVVVDHGLIDTAARAKQLAVEAEMRPLKWPAVGPDYVLPAVCREKAVIRACNQLGCVLELDRIPGLDARPLVEDLSDGEPPIRAAAHGPIDRIPDLDIGDPLRAAVGHQDPGSRADAVGTRMAAAPVGVDCPAERHPRALRHAVEDRLGVHLVEAHVERLGCVESAHGGGIAVARQLALLVAVQREVAPTHERMFA